MMEHAYRLLCQRLKLHTKALSLRVRNTNVFLSGKWKISVYNINIINDNSSTSSSTATHHHDRATACRTVSFLSFIPSTQHHNWIKNCVANSYCDYKLFTRWFSSSFVKSKKLSPGEVKMLIEELNSHFEEARDLLGDARESLGSTYFSEDMSDAQKAVSAAVAAYKQLLADLDENQRPDVVRTIGLRMEELKTQEQAIKDLLD